MRTDSWFDSHGAGRIHVCRWTPEGEPKAVFQIVHGIAEFIERYDGFADYLTKQGYLVVAEDHMGHGQSINGDGIQGYFHGGWFTAVEDTFQLLTDTRKEFPNLPYILFGHSMGSFMARTLLCKYPDCGITAAIICGTGWQPAFAPVNLGAMRKDLPVFFISGGDDPVGNYGKGVLQSANAFRKAGMNDVTVRIYPLCRHELLNEINKEEVYEDITQWLGRYLFSCVR